MVKFLSPSSFSNEKSHSLQVILLVKNKVKRGSFGSLSRIEFLSWSDLNSHPKGTNQEIKCLSFPQSSLTQSVVIDERQLFSYGSEEIDSLQCNGRARFRHSLNGIKQLNPRGFYPFGTGIYSGSGKQRINDQKKTIEFRHQSIVAQVMKSDP
jgi:hypothetical protein